MEFFSIKARASIKIFLHINPLIKIDTQIIVERKERVGEKRVRKIK